MSSSSSTATSTESKNKEVVFLVAAIHAFLVAFPSLIFSLTQNTDQDLSVKLLFDPEAAKHLSSGLTKDLYEIALWTIVVLSYGYYRAYQDGANNQPWIVTVAGCNKLGGAALLASWYLQGHVTVLFVLLGAVPELLLGLYIVNKWRKSGSKLVVVGSADPGEDKNASSNPVTAPRNWVFGFATVHVFLIAFPSLLLSITGNTDKDIGSSLMFDKAGVSLLSSSGLARDWMQFFFYLLVWYSFGYGRIYLDGATRQPLMVLMGGILKVGIATMCLSWQFRGDALPGIALGYVPDFALAFYYLKVWWVDLGGAYYYEPVAKGKKQ